MGAKSTVVMVLGLIFGLALFGYLGFYTKQELDRMIEESPSSSQTSASSPRGSASVRPTIAFLAIDEEEGDENHHCETPPEEVAEMMPLRVNNGTVSTFIKAEVRPC